MTMSDTPWTQRHAGLAQLDEVSRQRLDALRPVRVPKGTVLFRPGQEVSGFFVILAGEVSVHLTGPTGREILLYAVKPGETCVQTTLGLLGGEDYAGEAIADSQAEAVVVPKALFMDLMGQSEPFRAFVFRAFASRMQAMMGVIERVAFLKVEARLAEALLDRADTDGTVTATHQEIAVMIGSAREVVSRRLEALARQGLVSLERGAIRIIDRAGLVRLAG